MQIKLVVVVVAVKRWFIKEGVKREKADDEVKGLSGFEINNLRTLFWG